MRSGWTQELLADYRRRMSPWAELVYGLVELACSRSCLICRCTHRAHAGF
jgi:hypothetical protein